MRKFIAIIMLLLADAGHADDIDFKVSRIAHAGGGILGNTYTNSYEALNLNIRNGFLYFEDKILKRPKMR